MSTVTAMISVLFRLHRFSAGTLRQALRATLKSTLARKALEREGSERDGSVRPDGTSSAALLETHGHLILSGSLPQPSSIKWKAIFAIHMASCDLCRLKGYTSPCIYTKWIRALSHGYLPAMHGIPKPDPDLPQGILVESSPNSKVGIPVKKDSNYSSFSDLGSYARVAMAELVEGRVLTRLDKFHPAPEIFKKFTWLSGIRSCSLGIVLKKRDIAEGVKIGLDITQESDSRTFDAHRALRGMKAPKRRLILDPTRAGINAKIVEVPFSYPKRSNAERILRKGDWMAKTDLEAYFHQFPMAPEATCLFSVVWLGVLYGFLRCPFGIASLPFFCSIMSAFISEHLWKLGIDHAFLLDDYFTRATTLEEAKFKISKINEFIRSIGFPVQETKVEYGQALTFLGVVYDTIEMTTRIEPSAALGTLYVIQNHILPHLHHRKGKWTSDPLSQYQTSIASLTGTLNWYCETTASGRCRLGSLYALHKFGSRTHSHTLAQVVTDLEWWSKQLNIWSQANSPLGAYPLLTADALYSIQDSPIMCVQTDASGVDGRGGYYGKLSAKRYQ